MNTSENRILRPDVVATVLEDGAVLLDLKTKFFYSLNASSWAIVQMFETGTTIDKVLAQCTDWGATAKDRQSITDFLDVLTNDELITPSQTPAAEYQSTLDQGWSIPTIEKHKEPLQRIMTSAFDPTLPLAE